MLNQEQKLTDKLFSDDMEQEPTRNGFGRGLVEAGEKDEKVVVLCADLAESTRVHWFRKKFPERYVEIGVAEQNLVAVAGGLANYGKIPFVASYATFSPGRNNEQIRTIASLSNLPVKIVGAHAGVSVGPDGATHQALEDIALMRVQPNMVVVVPADSEEARKATLAIAINDKPSYIRLGRSATPVVTTKESPLEIGKANLLYDHNEPQAALIACGSLVCSALEAAKELEEEGIGVLVLNNHTVKPMDAEAVVDVAKRAGAVVTIEEHQVAGGMGSAVAEVLARECPVPIEFVGVQDKFGQSGTPEELIKHYGMDKDSIKEAAKSIIVKK